MPPSIDVKALGKSLAGQLTLYDRNYYELPEDDLWGARGENIPSEGTLPLGVEEIQSFRKQVIGEASVTDGKAYDVPLVDFGIVGTKAKAIAVIAGAEWSQFDIMRSQISAGLPIAPVTNIVQEKIEAVSIAINRRIHRLVYGGMSEIGFEGLFNSSKISPINALADGNLYGTTTPLTPTQLTDWFQGKIATFKVTSRLPYERIVAYVDDNLYTALCRPIGDNTGDTPYMRLTNPERGRFLGDILPITELAPQTLVDIGVLSNAATQGRIVMGDLRNTRSVKRYFAAIDRTDPFLKETGIHFGVTGWAGTSEVDFKVPERFAYINFAHT